jgi:hypothetical protein
VGPALALPFAYVANFISDDVSAYSIDASTGALTPVAGSPFAEGLGPISVVTTETHVPPVPTLNDWMLVALMGLWLVTGAAWARKRAAPNVRARELCGQR